MTPVVILGCGYTGTFVARRLLRRNAPVIAASRHPEQLHLPGADVVQFDVTKAPDLGFIPAGSVVVYSVPTVPGASGTVEALARKASRVVYISTTGVYGSAHFVDHTTPPAPNSEEGRERIQTEDLIRSNCASTLILRPAAIYGPGRGVHVRMLEGSFRMAGTGDNYVSRIHVDDLAAHIDAALTTDLTGAWPVADELACRSREIAQFCAELLRVPIPPPADPSSLHMTRQANRRVDGTSIRTALGIRLLYPTYREGIPASVEHPGRIQKR